MNRRFFLRGLGASLAIPFMPSLARAQGMAPPKSMIMYATHHGGVWRDNMFPRTPMSGVDTQMYAGRPIRRFDLGLAVNNGVASLSPVLSAPSSRFTSALAQKMLVLHGLDIPFGIGHHTGGYLGNFARNDGNGSDGRRAQLEAARRTIDQIMGWSPSFYPDLGSVRERVIVLGPGISYNHSNPAMRTGPIEEIGTTSPRPASLFDRMFPPMMGARAPIVDRVLESYQRMRGSARISAADKRRLDDHMQRIAELDRKLSVGRVCTTPARPTGPDAGRTREDLIYQPAAALDPAAHAAHYKLMNEILAAAMACELTRAAVINVAPTFSTYPGDWHPEVAHQANHVDGVRQQVMALSKQHFFADVFLDLAERLEAIDMGDGTTLLDRTLAWWTQESGSETHDPVSMPVVAFGGAGGAIRTGQYVDYRNLGVLFNRNVPALQTRNPGLVWQQWLGTVLEAMGVPRAEWENRAVNGGYPDYALSNVQFADIDASIAYPSAVWAASPEFLPWLRP